MDETRWLDGRSADLQKIFDVLWRVLGDLLGESSSPKRRSEFCKVHEQVRKKNLG